MACITPFFKRDVKAGLNITVPCGKCPECYKRRISGWSFRLMQEDKHSTMAVFSTLTYTTEHVPMTRNGYMTLDKKDIQDFFKRLRAIHYEYEKANDVTLPPIKYYAVGEYGGRFRRPHYHVLIFNATPAAIDRAWHAHDRTAHKKVEFSRLGKTYKKIVPCGPYSPIGNILHGSVTGASVGYTLKYMMKEGVIPMHRNDDRQREFSLMSKGLGASYITPQMIEWHKSDLTNRMHHVIEGGKLIAMPRYYKDKIYTEQERKIIAWAAIEQNIKNEIEKTDEEIRLFGENNYLRVRVERDALSFKKMYQNAKTGRNNELI